MRSKSISCPFCKKELTADPQPAQDGATVYQCACKGKPREVVKIYPPAKPESAPIAGGE